MEDIGYSNIMKEMVDNPPNIEMGVEVVKLKSLSILSNSNSKSAHLDKELMLFFVSITLKYRTDGLPVCLHFSPG